jgi:microcystin-dependent protein
VSQPYVGEIRMFAGSFAPINWAICDGSLLPISENETLFVLIGTTYGGDGESTFALPDLRGRAPVHMGTGSGLTPRFLGEAAGVETVTLTAAQIPAHTHTLNASKGAGAANGKFPSVSTLPAFGPASSTVAMASGAIVASAGPTQPHDNMPPYPRYQLHHLALWHISVPVLRLPHGSICR